MNKENQVNYAENAEQFLEQVKTELYRLLVKVGVPIALVVASLSNPAFAGAQVETPPTSTVTPYTVDTSTITKEIRILKWCSKYLTSPLVSPEEASRLYEQCCILLSKKSKTAKTVEPTTFVAPIKTPVPPSDLN